MTSKKILVVAALATLCLAATVFLVLPIKSATNATALNSQAGNIANDEQGKNKCDGQKTLQNYTEALSFNVLDVGRMVNGTEYGICTMSCGGFFTFNPKGNFVRVTNLTYTLEAYKDIPGFHTHDYTLSINYHDAEADHLELIDFYPTSRCQGADPSWVKPGLNLVGLQFYEYMFVLKLNVYIEYQYQA
jgi:hypothetical protein